MLLVCNPVLYKERNDLIISIHVTIARSITILVIELSHVHDYMYACMYNVHVVIAKPMHSAYTVQVEKVDG